MFNFFRKSGTGATAAVQQVTPITPVEVRDLSGTMKYHVTWVCTGPKCTIGKPGHEPKKATITIHARDERPDGPSNFVAVKGGHSKLPSSDLTWNGLIEERGWKSNPVLCPACQRGMTIREYKEHRRKGGL